MWKAMIWISYVVNQCRNYTILDGKEFHNNLLTSDAKIRFTVLELWLSVYRWTEHVSVSLPTPPILDFLSCSKSGIVEVIVDFKVISKICGESSMAERKKMLAYTHFFSYRNSYKTVSKTLTLKYLANLLSSFSASCHVVSSSVIKADFTWNRHPQYVECQAIPHPFHCPISHT